jgi:hypothetical protein
MAKVGTAGGVVLLILLLAITTVGTYIWLAGGNQQTAVATTAPAASQADATETFQSVYGIPADETIRNIPRPFSPVRMDFYHQQNPSQEGVPAAILVYWVNAKPVIWASRFGGGGFSAKDLINNILHVYPQELEGDSQLAQEVIPGDFVIRGDPKNPDKEQLRQGLIRILGDALGQPVTLTFREVGRSVIVLHGTWQARNADGTPLHLADGEFQTVEIYGDELNKHSEFGGGGSGPVAEFAQWVGWWIKQEVVIETTGAPGVVRWHENDDDLSPQGHTRAHDQELVLKHVAEQTGLTWTHETRKVTRLFLEYAK